MEFLVAITTTVPDGTDPVEVDRRWSAEGVRARELAETGHLIRLWRPVGERRSVGIWKAEDLPALQAIFASLPLHDWMRFDITPLESHPNDPGRERS